MRIVTSALICASMLLGGPVFAAETNNPNDHELRLHIPEAGKILLTVHQKIDQVKNEQANNVDLSYTYENAYTTKGDAYEIHPVLVSSKLNSFNGNVPPPGVDTSAITGAMLLVNGVDYMATSDFGPDKIDDMAALKANYRAFILKISASQDPVIAKQPDFSQRMDEAVEKVFGLMTPESAASTFLPESVLLSWPHNTGLVLGEKTITKAQESLPMGGLIDVTISMVLTSWNEKNDTAIVTWDSIPDPASATAVLNEIMPKIVAQMGGGDIKAPAASSLKLERHCQYTVAISTGLISAAECSTQKGFVIGEMQQLETHTNSMSEKLQK